MGVPFEAETRKAAVMSDCGGYRFSLLRRWGEPGAIHSVANFIMLNPSTADAELDDPTIRRCMGFARSWGYDGIDVTNLFALRSTDPSALLSSPDPIGENNDTAIVGTAQLCDLVICAWGCHKAIGPRAAHVLKRLRDAGIQPKAIRLTKDGHPAHPLYLPASCSPVALAP
jgi:hypothetical protein